MYIVYSYCSSKNQLRKQTGLHRLVDHLVVLCSSAGKTPETRNEGSRTSGMRLPSLSVPTLLQMRKFAQAGQAEKKSWAPHGSTNPSHWIPTSSRDHPSVVGCCRIT